MKLLRYYILKYKDKLKEVRDNINKSQVLLIDLSKKEEKITSDIRLLQERNKYRGEESLISNNIITLKEDILSIRNKLTNYNNNIEVLDNKISNINNNINEYKGKIDNLIIILLRIIEILIVVFIKLIIQRIILIIIYQYLNRLRVFQIILSLMVFIMLYLL